MFNSIVTNNMCGTFMVVQTVRNHLQFRRLEYNPVSGRSLVERNGNPLQNSYLKNSMDRGAWQAYSPYGCKELDMTEHSTAKMCVNILTV